MSFKKVVLAALFTIPASQAFGAEVSGNVALTSDYKFRGISQSDSAPSIQGGFDVAFDNGVYIGTWGAAVDFDCAIDTCGGLNGGIELDYFAGFAADINESVSYDIGYIYYDYPQDEGLLGDYGEIYGSLSFGDFEGSRNAGCSKGSPGPKILGASEPKSFDFRAVSFGPFGDPPKTQVA